MRKAPDYIGQTPEAKAADKLLEIAVLYCRRQLQLNKHAVLVLETTASGEMCVR